MELFDFLFGEDLITNLENDIINDDNQSGLFPENDKIYENCDESLQYSEFDNEHQSQEDVGTMDYDEIEKMVDVDKSNFDDKNNVKK